MITKYRSKQTRSGFMSAALVALIVPSALVAMSGPASAATTHCIYQGDDRACATEYGPDYSTLQVCDNEADGNGVYALLYGDEGHDPLRVGDGNGSAAGCGTGSMNEDIFIIRICEDDWGSDTCVGRYWEQL